jgi:hypothetical protein
LEIALNLVWLGVSIALVMVCGFHTTRAGEHRSRAMAAVALVCLICLLFPVISMTDDLNSNGPALVESSKLKRLAASAHAVLTLLSLPTLLAPQENRWATLDREPEDRRPLEMVFIFNLHRRPPPHQLRTVLG